MSHLESKSGLTEDAIHLESLKPETNNGSTMTIMESQYDPALEAHLRHKFDRRIMPLGIVIFLVAQIDRSNMGNAKILGQFKQITCC